MQLTEEDKIQVALGTLKLWKCSITYDAMFYTDILPCPPPSFVVYAHNLDDTKYIIDSYHKELTKKFLNVYFGYLQ